MDSFNLPSAFIGFMFAIAGAVLMDWWRERKTKERAKRLLLLEMDQNLRELESYWDDIRTRVTVDDSIKDAERVRRLSSAEMMNRIPFPAVTDVAWKSQAMLIPEIMTYQQIEDARKIYEAVEVLRSNRLFLYDLEFNHPRDDRMMHDFGPLAWDQCEAVLGEVMRTDNPLETESKRAERVLVRRTKQDRRMAERLRESERQELGATLSVVNRERGDQAIRGRSYLWVYNSGPYRAMNIGLNVDHQSQSYEVEPAEFDLEPMNGQEVSFQFDPQDHDTEAGLIFTVSASFTDGNNRPRLEYFPMKYTKSQGKWVAERIQIETRV